MGGGIAAMAVGVVKRMSAEGERSSASRCGGFPVLWLELIEKRSWLGDFKCRLAAARLVSVDLDKVLARSALAQGLQPRLVCQTHVKVTF